VSADWGLEDFPERLEDWLDREHPSQNLYEQVGAWWPQMRYAGEWAAAGLADDEATADGGGEDNVLFMPVPGCYEIDEAQGTLGVVVIFEVSPETDWVRCRAFHTVVQMTPAEVDRADGMGTG
jgi:hypothetical protein